MKGFVQKLVRNRRVLLSFVEKLVIDVILYNFAELISVWLRFDYSLKTAFIHIDDPIGIVSNVIFIFFDIAFRLPEQIWGYASLKEISDVFFTVTFSKIVFGLILYLFKPRISWSRGVYVISWIIAIFLLSGVRLSIRIYKEMRQSKRLGNSTRRQKNVLIIGAGDAGEKVIREIEAHPELNYKIFGILDDDLLKKGGKIHGHTVIGPIERLPGIVKDFNIDVILIAIPSAPKSVLRRIVSLASDTKAEIKTLPGIWEIIDGRVEVGSIRNVKLEDLLPRPEIRTGTKDIERYIKGKTVLVTGAGGSIGSEIVRQVIKFRPKKVILLDKQENGVFRVLREIEDKDNFKNAVPVICDIRNRKKVFWAFEKYKPDIVFHTAAHKHVPLMEENPDEAVTNNVFGTKNLLDAAKECGTERFINISTDKAVNPTSIMGASKRVIEMMLQYYAKRNSKTVFTSVRFGNVLGSAGSVIEVFSKQLRETGVLTITDPRMERYFMLIPEAVQLVLHAGAMGKGGEIFVLKMGERINIMELAKTFAKLSGFEVGKDVKIKIIGNRGGEKIAEELWNENEKVEETENPYILRIKTNGSALSKEKFFELLDNLKSAAERLDFKLIRQILEELIPEAELIRQEE